MHNQEFLHIYEVYKTLKKRYEEILNTAFSIDLKIKSLKVLREPKRILQQAFTRCQTAGHIIKETGDH